MSPPKLDETNIITLLPTDKLDQQYHTPLPASKQCKSNKICKCLTKSNDLGLKPEWKENTLLVLFMHENPQKKRERQIEKQKTTDCRDLIEYSVWMVFGSIIFGVLCENWHVNLIAPQ